MEKKAILSGSIDNYFKPIPKKKTNKKYDKPQNI